MSVVRDVVALGRKLREEHKHQGAPAARAAHRRAPRPERARDARSRRRRSSRDELNVKARRASKPTRAPSPASRVKPNFKTLGKRCGPKLKEIGAELARWGFAEVARLEAGEQHRGRRRSARARRRPPAALALDGRRRRHRRRAHRRARHRTSTTRLRREGIAREFVSLLQNARKDAGLEVTDRIRVSWSCHEPEVRAALGEHAEAIAREVLAVQFAEGPTREQSRLQRARRRLRARQSLKA